MNLFVRCGEDLIGNEGDRAHTLAATCGDLFLPFLDRYATKTDTEHRTFGKRHFHGSFRGLSLGMGAVDGASFPHRRNPARTWPDCLASTGTHRDGGRKTARTSRIFARYKRVCLHHDMGVCDGVSGIAALAAAKTNRQPYPIPFAPFLTVGLLVYGLGIS